VLFKVGHLQDFLPQSSRPCHASANSFDSNHETQAVSSALLLICLLNYVCLVWNACVKQSGHNPGVLGEPKNHVERDALFGNKLHHGSFDVAKTQESGMYQPGPSSKLSTFKPQKKQAHERPLSLQPISLSTFVNLGLVLCC
jgi:hypothetical protein